MTLLFAGSAIALFIAILMGELAARGRESMLHALTVQARSATSGLLLVAGGAGAFTIGVWLMLWIVQSLL